LDVISRHVECLASYEADSSSRAERAECVRYRPVLEMEVSEWQTEIALPVNYDETRTALENAGSFGKAGPCRGLPDHVNAKHAVDARGSV
jgi:hypothetical protein